MNLFPLNPLQCAYFINTKLNELFGLLENNIILVFECFHNLNWCIFNKNTLKWRARTTHNVSFNISNQIWRENDQNETKLYGEYNYEYMPETICQFIHYFPSKQELAINLLWTTLKSKQLHVHWTFRHHQLISEDSHLVGTWVYYKVHNKFKKKNICWVPGREVGIIEHLNSLKIVE